MSTKQEGQANFNFRVMELREACMDKKIMKNFALFTILKGKSR